MSASISSHKLQENSFGFWGQLVQSIAHMAPAIGVILNAQFMASRAGPALPLASLCATVLAVMLAYCLGLLTKKYFGASGYFQIHSKALGSPVGFTTSWLFFLYEPFNAFWNQLGFGVLILEPFSRAHFGVTIPWWTSIIVGNLLITGCALTTMHRSIKITALLGGIEFLIMLALGILLLAHTDGNIIHPEYFNLSSSADGIGGLMFAFIFGFTAFVGYESGLPLTEETAQTTKNTFRGLMFSVLIAGAFYVLLGYATVVGYGGGGNPVQFAKEFSGAADPYGSVLALKAFGAIGGWLIFFAALNSTIGCGLAGHNATTRVFFSLGRAGILPRFLGNVSAHGKVPRNATLFAAGLTFLWAIIFVFVSRGENLMGWFGYMCLQGTIPILIIHLMTCLSVFIVYRYRHPHDFKLFHHAIIPLFTALLTLVPLGGAIYYNQDWPMSYAPVTVAAWFLVGLVVYMWLKRKQPHALAKLESEMDTLRA